MSPYFSALDLSTDTGRVNRSSEKESRTFNSNFSIVTCAQETKLNRYVNLGRDHPEVVVTLVNSVFRNHDTSSDTPLVTTLQFNGSLILNAVQREWVSYEKLPDHETDKAVIVKLLTVGFTLGGTLPAFVEGVKTPGV